MKTNLVRLFFVVLVVVGASLWSPNVLARPIWIGSASSCADFGAVDPIFRLYNQQACVDCIAQNQGYVYDDQVGDDADENAYEGQCKGAIDSSDQTTASTVNACPTLPDDDPSAQLCSYCIEQRKMQFTYFNEDPTDSACTGIITGGKIQTSEACSDYFPAGRYRNACINCVSSSKPGVFILGRAGGTCDRNTINVASNGAVQIDDPSPFGIGINSLDIAGGNCGFADSENNKCCAPSEATVNFNLNVPDIEVPGAGGGGWGWNPTRWPAKAVQTVINVPVEAGENALNSLIYLFTNVVLDKSNDFADAAQYNLIQSGLDPACVEGTRSTEDASDPACICQKQVAGVSSFQELCENVSDETERSNCNECVSKDGKNLTGVWTGIGCMPANPASIIENSFFGIGVGLAGGVAFLCILYSAFVLQVSRGNPERVKKAREYLTSCIMGLLLIVFSILILQLIGVDILRIPGFRGRVPWF